MFRINNINFTACSTVSILDFEHVITRWLVSSNQHRLFKYGEIFLVVFGRSVELTLKNVNSW